MRYTLIINAPEPAPGEISEETIEEMMRLFAEYADALHSAGVLVAAEVLQPSEATTTVTRRGGELQIQDGPFADTKESLAGIFVLDVEDIDAALAWAQRCPAISYATIEVRPAGTSYVDGAWTHP